MRDKAWELKCILTEPFRNFSVVGRDFLNKRARRWNKMSVIATHPYWRPRFCSNFDQKDVRRTRILIFFTYKVFCCSVFQQHTHTQNQTETKQKSKPQHPPLWKKKQQLNNNPDNSTVSLSCPSISEGQ